MPRKLNTSDKRNALEIAYELKLNVLAISLLINILYTKKYPIFYLTIFFGAYLSFVYLYN